MSSTNPKHRSRAPCAEKKRKAENSQSKSQKPETSWGGRDAQCSRSDRLDARHSFSRCLQRFAEIFKTKEKELALLRNYVISYQQMLHFMSMLLWELQIKVRDTEDAFVEGHSRFCRSTSTIPPAGLADQYREFEESQDALERVKTEYDRWGHAYHKAQHDYLQAEIDYYQEKVRLITGESKLNEMEHAFLQYEYYPLGLAQGPDIPGYPRLYQSSRSSIEAVPLSKILIDNMSRVTPKWKDQANSSTLIELTSIFDYDLKVFPWGNVSQLYPEILKDYLSDSPPVSERTVVSRSARRCCNAPRSHRIQSAGHQRDSRKWENSTSCDSLGYQNSSHSVHYEPEGPLLLTNKTTASSSLSWGKAEATKWKRSSGRSKEWRRCKFSKANKQPQALNEYCLLLKKETLTVPNHVAPTTFRRRDKGFKLVSWAHLRTKEKYQQKFDVQELNGEDKSCNIWGNGIVRSNQSSRLVAFEELYPTNARVIASSTFTIPHEAYLGAVLGATFRLNGLLRQENHGDVYAAEDLWPTGILYEIKAYELHGIPKKLYGYRIRNLKKLTAKASFACSFNQYGRKYVVNRVIHELESAKPGTSKNRYGKVHIGAIGRKKTKEFEEAFPKLPRPQNLNKLEQGCKPPSDLGCVAFATYGRGNTLRFSKTIEAVPVGPEAQALQPDSGTKGDLVVNINKLTFPPTQLSMQTNQKTSHSAKSRTPAQKEQARIRQKRARQRKKAQNNLSNNEGV